MLKNIGESCTVSIVPNLTPFLLLLLLLLLAWGREDRRRENPINDIRYFPTQNGLGWRNTAEEAKAQKERFFFFSLFLKRKKDAFFPFLRLSIAAFCDANFPLPLPAKRINSFQINTVYFLLGTDKGKGRDWTLLFFVAAAGGGKKVWQG